MVQHYFRSTPLHDEDGNYCIIETELGVDPGDATPRVYIVVSDGTDGDVAGFYADAHDVIKAVEEAAGIKKDEPKVPLSHAHAVPKEEPEGWVNVRQVPLAREVTEEFAMQAGRGPGRIRGWFDKSTGEALGVRVVNPHGDGALKVPLGDYVLRSGADFSVVDRWAFENFYERVGG